MRAMRRRPAEVWFQDGCTPTMLGVEGRMSSDRCDGLPRLFGQNVKPRRHCLAQTQAEV